MALKIRLRQQGRANRQTFRLVVADSRSPRDGKYLEMLGWYIPFSPDNAASVDAERLNYWLNQGAEISERVENLLGRIAPDVIAEYRTKKQKKRAKDVAQRKALKKAAKK